MNSSISSFEYDSFLLSKKEKDYINRFKKSNCLKRSYFFSSKFSGYGFFLTKYGKLMGYAYDNSSYEKFGLERKEGDDPKLNNFFEIKFFRNKSIDGIYMGNQHTLFHLSDGRVYVCGENSYGQCCMRSSNSNLNLCELKKKFIPKNKKIIKISCGAYSTHVIMNDMNAYSCGWNVFGQLGFVANGSVSKLTRVKIQNERIFHISSGFYFTIFLSLSKKVFGCGQTSSGQVSNSDEYSISVPVEIIFFRYKCINKIRCGYDHTIVKVDDGSCYGFGKDNAFENMEGNPPFPPIKLKWNYKDFSCGASSTIFLCNDNVYTYGNCSMVSSFPKTLKSWMPIFPGKNVLEVVSNNETFVIVAKSGVYMMGKGFNKSINSHPTLIKGIVDLKLNNDFLLPYKLMKRIFFCDVRIYVEKE